MVKCGYKTGPATCLCGTEPQTMDQPPQVATTPIPMNKVELALYNSAAEECTNLNKNENIFSQLTGFYFFFYVIMTSSPTIDLWAHPIPTPPPPPSPPPSPLSLYPSSILTYTQLWTVLSSSTSVESQWNRCEQIKHIPHDVMLVTLVEFLLTALFTIW